MIKYFKYKRSRDWKDCPLIDETIYEVNSYAKEHDLKVISVTCDRDQGIFVVFEKTNCSETE